MAAHHHFERRPIQLCEDHEGFLSAAALAALMIGVAVVIVTFGAMLLRVS